MPEKPAPEQEEEESPSEDPASEDPEAAPVPDKQTIGWRVSFYALAPEGYILLTVTDDLPEG